MVKVVHIIDSLRGGGAERLLEYTLPAMRTYGVEPAVLYLNDETACLPGLVAAGIPTLCLRPGETSGFRALQRSAPQRAKDTTRASAFCREFGAQVLHAHLHGSYLLAPGLARRLRLPYVVTDHLAADPWQTAQSLNGRLLRRMYIRSYSGAARVVCVSSAVRDHLRDTMGLTRLRYEVIENAVDDLFWTPVPQEGERNLDVILCGRLSHQKGYPFALEALAALKELRSGLRAGIVGTGSLEKEVRAWIVEFGLDDHVRLLGRKSAAEVRDLMDHSRSYFMPSIAEGLGIAAVEALARGLPAVLSDIDVFRALFGDLEGVKLVSHGDPKAAAAALDAAIGRPLFDRRAALSPYALATHGTRMAAMIEAIVSR